MLHESTIEKPHAGQASTADVKQSSKDVQAQPQEGTLASTSVAQPGTEPAQSQVIALRHLLGGDAHQDLGDVRPITGVRTSLDLGKVASNPIEYPPVVVQALSELFSEYNQQFQQLIHANREFSTDYRYAKDASGNFANSFVQIDMLGLPADFLTRAAQMEPGAVREVLRHSIFEIENSLAMYQLLERALSTSEQSIFSKQFRLGLDDLRTQHGRPIVLLAVTEEKYQAMRASEFGKVAGEPLSKNEVREMSGFDGLFGPEEFKRHLAKNNGRCECLLYVRASDPPSKLRDPNAVVGSELLEDPRMRQIIKEYAITFNIDAPHQHGSARINDTKGYLHPMKMAFDISRPEELMSTSGELSPAFATHLAEKGIDPGQVLSGEVQLRAKPLRGTYGCYGHIRGPLQHKFMKKLREEMQGRGDYVVQPEMETPRVTNASDGQTYTYIDRNFMSYTAGEFRFLGGMRTLMLLDSSEARKGRIHGSKESVYQLVY